MTGSQAVACLTTGATAGVLLLGLGTLRAAFRARRQARRPALVAPVNRDVTAQERRPAPPVVTPERTAHDELVKNIFGPEYLIVARPLWWDTTERKESEL